MTDIQKSIVGNGVGVALATALATNMVAALPPYVAKEWFSPERVCFDIEVITTAEIAS